MLSITEAISNEDGQMFGIQSTGLLIGRRRSESIKKVRAMQQKNLSPIKNPDPE